MANLHITFGPMAPSIEEQLRTQEMLFLDCAEVQRDADALNRLMMRDLLTEAEVARARLRLTKRIAKLIDYERRRSARP